jgi:hypothetical protein
MSQQIRSAWRVPLALVDVPEAGRHMELAADTPTRAAVARSIGVQDLRRLLASFTISRHGRDGLRIVGTVSAQVEQTCVVTLEPVESDVSEPVEVVFAPHTRADGVTDTIREAPQDAPDPLINGVVDLGAVAIEFLTLGIDPYPRKAGAEFKAPDAGDEAPHPFAGLAALRGRLGDP